MSESVMSPSVIRGLSALEILDSRGKPTVKATCELKSGARASASVPSGASTGTAEAHELRDGDLTRYRGQGCRKAVANVNAWIFDTVRGVELNQIQLDELLANLDGTVDKSEVGANATLAVSLAFARAVAVERGVPLYRHFADLVYKIPAALPRMTINLFSGGKHGGGQVPIQDVLVIPVAATTINEGLATTYAVYQAAAELSQRKYGMRPLTADEGGLAPPFSSVEAAFDDAVEAIRAAGFEPGRDVALAVDVASTHFFRDGQYHLAGETLHAAGMIDRVASWVERYPIISVEDGLAEDDWVHWPLLRERIGRDALVLGDDLLCTNPHRIRRALQIGAANALLLKVNQIGTVGEADDALRAARKGDWRVTISARSGETEDDWLADLAVGWGGDQIKVGSITQSERLAKYNRLLEIEAQTKLPVVAWPNPR